jgi:redox-sensitive bicupin YhaK (pirin superfamily)
MLTTRRSRDRGGFNNVRLARGSLDTRHTFSFGHYHDPNWMGFRALRVINDDTVSPGAGFPPHPHEDMEILTWILSGALQHKDSSGGGGVIRPGELQRMSAGRGVVHSEFNASATEPVHLLQIWIHPDNRYLGIPPSYEQRSFPEPERRGQLRLIAAHAPAPDTGAATIHADASVHAGLFRQGERATLPIAPGRAAWAHVARGELTINTQPLSAGDAIALENEPELTIEGSSPADAEVLVFDLA